MTQPLKNARTFRWTIVAFTLAALFMAGLVIWQLMELSPTRYCAIAEATDGKDNEGCVSILLKLLDNKDHALIGSLLILGITILCTVAVALGVNIKATGPGGSGVDLGSNDDDTTVAQGDTEIVIPAPSSE